MLGWEHPLIVLIPLLVIAGLKLLVRSHFTLCKTLSLKEGVSFRRPTWKVIEAFKETK